ncbi:MAG: MobF family relaxase, partial [Oligoflexus sp.]
MLSIGAIGGSGKAHNYYAKYCQEAGEEEGQWVGQAKGRMGLEGSVSADTMKELLAGFDGKGNKLVKNAGREDRRGGFDLTFSAPKSVSVVWAGANEAMRERIESEFKGACQDALSYLQDFEGFSRKGVNGQEKVKAELLGSLFLHSSNREGEPNLHGHLVLKNLGYCEDGVWRTIDGMGIFKSKMAAGNVFKASFASRLQSLGFSVRQTKDSFEIDGVKQTVCQAMSTRSQQIEAYLKEKWGLTREQASAKQLQVAALDTRQGKEAVENRRDFLKWQTKLSEHGFTRQSVEFLQQGGANKKKFTSKVKNDAISAALERITAQHSTFTQRQLHSEIVKELIGKASPAQIDLCLRTVVDSAHVVRLADDRFTSIGVQAMERGLVRSMLNRSDEGRHLISEASLAKVLSDRKTLSLEQTAVLRHLAGDRSAASMVRGYAGAGKSFTMGAVADAYRLDGYRVIGLAPSNKAKIGLSDSIKADAHTLDSFSLRLENRHTRLGPKDVLIIDEAAMASSKKLQPIIEKVNAARAKLIFVGDESQLQPIDAGQLFGTLYQKLSGVELKEIYRQERVSEA